ALLHPLISGQEQRLGLGVLLLAQQAAAEQGLVAERVDVAAGVDVELVQLLVVLHPLHCLAVAHARLLFVAQLPVGHGQGFWAPADRFAASRRRQFRRPPRPTKHTERAPATKTTVEGYGTGVARNP